MPSDAITQKKRDKNPKSSPQNGVNKKKKKKNKNKNKHESKNTYTDHLGAHGAKPKATNQLPPPAAPSSSKKKGGLLDQMRQRLQGGQFRWLNEQLYTTGGDKALTLMRKNPELYDKYHEGEQEMGKTTLGEEIQKNIFAAYFHQPL